MTNDGARRGDYRAARIGAAVGLVGTVIAVLLIDAMSTEYEASAVIITSVLGAAAALLGVEIIDFVRRKQ